MPKFKVTHNIKPKRTQQADCQSFEDLNNWIDTTFNIQIKNIKFQKPRIKDEATFLKEVKEGIQITILGQARKDKTEQQLKKDKQLLEKIEVMKEQLKLNAHEKVLKVLNQKNIKERGIQFFNTQTNQPQDLGIEYALMPLHMLKMVPQFKKYCYNYQVMQKNPDGLIIEELAAIFKEMEKGQGIVCPLQWISAWITYCADDIQFPYPTYDIDYFLNKTFNTIKTAFDVELEKKQEEPNSRVDIATKYFGIEVLTKRTDITKLDEDDTEPQKQVDKKVIKFLLQCDLSRPDITSISQGIRQRFKQKQLWRNFYAFDIQYKQKIIAVQRLPKYVFVHAQRHGYCEARQQSQRVELFQHKKSYHKVRISRILDLYEYCDANLKQKLQLGRYQRHQMFYPYDMDERYGDFKNKIKHLNQLSDVEVRYMFCDHLLYEMNIFHEFFFEPVKNAKQTGEYRLIGVVLHKGDFYHHPQESHKHDCKGQFQVMVYQRGKTWVRYKRAEVDYVDIEQATNQKYWGGKQGEWTPVLFMYREIFMRNMQLQPPNKDTKRNKKAEMDKLKRQEEMMEH